MVKILYSPRFARKFRKLPRKVRERAVEKEQIFRRDPFDKSLKTHKLQGVFSGYWSFSIDFSHRIIFSFEDDGTVCFQTVGDHDVYYG